MVNSQKIELGKQNFRKRLNNKCNLTFYYYNQPQQDQFHYNLYLFVDAVMNQASSETFTSQNEFLPLSSPGIADFRVMRKLAVSGQASIYLAIRDEEHYVLKIYQAKGKDIKIFEKEVDILRKLNSRGIMPIEEISQNVQFANESLEKMFCNVIVMPYYENGDLLQWVRRYQPFNQKAARFFFKRLLSTFRFIVKKQIYHRDLKPENIVLDQNYEPLLLDFGLSGYYHQKNVGFVGSARYAAPEVIKQKEYTIKSQIYSLGILLFFLLTSCYPYSSAKINEVNYRLMFQRNYGTFWSNFQKKTNIVLSKSFKELFVHMTAPDPSKRPEIDRLLQFDWFDQEQSTQKQYFQYMLSKRQEGQV